MQSKIFWFFVVLEAISLFGVVLLQGKPRESYGKKDVLVRMVIGPVFVLAYYYLWKGHL